MEAGNEHGRLALESNLLLLAGLVLVLGAGGGVWFLVARAKDARGPHQHLWVEHRIGAALLRRVCSECGELSIGREPHHGISLENRERAVLFELRPELIAKYTKPRYLEIIHAEAGTGSFGKPRRKAG